MTLYGGLQALGYSIAPFLLDVAIKAMIWLLLVLLVDRCCSRKYAAWRSLLWQMCVIGLLLIPIAPKTLPRLHLSVLPAPPSLSEVSTGFHRTIGRRVDTEIPSSASLPQTPSISVRPVPSDNSTRPESESSRTFNGAMLWITVAVGVYLLGLCIMLLRLGAGLSYLSTFRQCVVPVRNEALLERIHICKRQLGIHRTVKLAMSDHIYGPTQIGFWSPIVVIPAGMLKELDGQGFKTIITHEFAHIRRHDYLFNLISGVALALYWFNPLSWLAVSRLREASEQACDDWSVELLDDPHLYANSLLELVAGMQRGRALALGMNVVSKPRIVKRITRIATWGGRVSPHIGRLAGAFVVMALLSGAIILGVSTANEKLTEKPLSHTLPGHEEQAHQVSEGSDASSRSKPEVDKSQAEPAVVRQMTLEPLHAHSSSADDEILPSKLDNDLYKLERVSVNPQMDRQKITSRIETAQLTGSLAEPNTAVRRSQTVAGIDLEPEALAEEVVGNMNAEQEVDLSSELLDFQALDTGKHHAMVIQDPEDKRNIEGFYHLSWLYIPRLHATATDPKSPMNQSARFVARTMPDLVYGLNQYTGIDSYIGKRISIHDPEIFQMPWIYYVSLSSYQLSDSELETLGGYLVQGGFLFADSDASQTYSGAASHVKALLAALRTQGIRTHFQRLPGSHPMYHCYFDFSALPAGADAWLRPGTRTPYLEGLEVKGRLVAVLSKKGYFAPWGEAMGKPSFERELQFGVNLIVFALTQEGSITHRLVARIR